MGLIKRPEWLMIGGFRVEEEIKINFEKNMQKYGYKTMVAAFRDFMRQVGDGTYNTAAKQETEINTIQKEINIIKTRLENVERGI